MVAAAGRSHGTPLLAAVGEPTCEGLLTETTQKDLECLSTLVVQGTLRSVLDREFAGSGLREAVSYEESGRLRGNNIVRMRALIVRVAA